jgi:hydroxyacylglutathione hydrolase
MLGVLIFSNKPPERWELRRKLLGAIPNSTFGYESKFNPVFKMALDRTEADFMKFILSGQPEPPLYFANMKKVNKYGLSFLKHIPMLMEFSVEGVALRMQKAEVLVLDTRPRDPFL